MSRFNGCRKIYLRAIKYCGLASVINIFCLATEDCKAKNEPTIQVSPGLIITFQSIVYERTLWEVICPYDLVRVLFKGTTIFPLKEKLQCGLNVAFDSKVARSSDKIIDIIKLEATLWV